MCRHFSFCFVPSPSLPLSFPMQGGNPAPRIPFSLRFFCASPVTIAPVRMSALQFAAVFLRAIGQACAAAHFTSKSPMGRKICRAVHKTQMLPWDSESGDDGCSSKATRAEVRWVELEVYVVQGDGCAIAVVKNLSRRYTVEVRFVFCFFCKC